MPARVEEVIIIEDEVVLGTGVRGDPYRTVLQIWSKDGKLKYAQVDGWVDRRGAQFLAEWREGLKESGCDGL